MNNQTTHSAFDISTWYQQPIGQAVAKQEQEQLKLLPKTLLGQTVLQLGSESYHDWLEISAITSYVTTAPAPAKPTSLSHVQANYSALPFPANAFDTILLPHVLEFSSNPKAIITECWHALAPEGHLIILGINPWSLTNLIYGFDKTKINLPTETKLHAVNKIYQWLRNNYYEIVYNHNFYYLPLTANEQYLKRISTFEKLATWLLPYCGSLYLLVLKKRVLPLTPLRLRWQWRDLLSNKNQLTEPAAGNVHRE